MKLAEALALRADYQKRLAQLRTRLSQSSKVQEGEDPPEDPRALMEEYEQISSDLADLVRKINTVNSTEELESGKTMAAALAEREHLIRQQNMLRNVIEEAGGVQLRYSNSEIKTIPTVNVRELQKQVDELAKQHRELDTKIQERNWYLTID